jgi:Rne/Rng family ribonuclease
MSKELVISSNRHETKVAILEDDQLVEIYFQRANEYSLAGSVHKGRVTRVLPGMQSAFVDLGLERDTFLYVSDFFDEHGEDIDRVVPTREERVREERGRGERPPRQQEAAPQVEGAAPGEGGAPTGERPQREYPRQEGGDDRRSRRSRRRRNRSHGFPDSKYAAGAPAAEEETSIEESEPAAPEAPMTGADFLLLPGESLAKYSRPAAGAEEDEDTDQTTDAPAPPASDAEDARLEANEELGFDFGTAPDTAPTATTPEAEAHATRDTAPAFTAHATRDTSPALAPAIEPQSPQPAARAESASTDNASKEPAPEKPEEAASEATSETDAEAAETSEPPDEPVHEPALASRAEVMGRPESLTAQVRGEPGGRYLHRGSRRMRRRMRGGQDRQGGRGEEQRSEERRVEPAEAIEPQAETPAATRAPESTAPMPSISDLLKEGQEIIVQIAKEPLGQKGARITSHIALPGRYVVYMPTVEHTGVSRKIGTDDERQRLKRILQTHRAGMPGGFILRTAGEGRTEDEIAADMNFLFNLWLDIRQKAEKHPAPVLLHHDLDIVQRILRDQLTDSFKSIWVDNEELYESVLRFVQRFQPALVGRVKLFTREGPIFDAFGVSTELEKALRPKVWLKSGGYIVINQTEALVAIDVNTGKYVGKSNRLEDTIVKTNTEAVKEIVRQIRLRDLGGIIVVDFIDMDERKNRQKVMQALEEAMHSDRAPYKILQFNDFGLVAITRKRVKQSLERALCSPCPYCEGAGYVKSVRTTVGEILQEAYKLREAVRDSKDVILRVHPEVARELKSSENQYLEELEEILGRPVLVKGDPTLHQEKYDLA